MRNLAVVTLTGMRFPGLAVAALMGLTPEYVSTLKGRARDHGSAGLVRELGRPTKLTGRQIAQSGRWRAEKVSAVVIGGTAGCGGTTVAHDPVTINGYGTARQITLFEHGKVALQVLTSGTSTCPVALLTTLRAHWRIENTFKYASEHHRIDALADYIADIETNTRPIDNPARKTANATVKARKNDLGDAETARDGAPAKLPANQIDPTPDAPSTHHPPHPEVDPEST